jgi:hypothetical protein
MPGTRHFSRMQYNVSRGLREIVAPKQVMSNAHWQSIADEFGGRCAFCGELGSRENRGIVPDHLVPVTQFGELVLGNTVPACQTCNDSRGEKDWRNFLREKFPERAADRTRAIEAYISRHSYVPISPQEALTPSELQEYNALVQDWERVLQTAKRLRESVAARRGGTRG